MKKTCNPELGVCCKISAYWRDLANADHACAGRLREERDGLQHIVNHLRLALREREAEITSMHASLAKRRKPVAGEYGPREVRRRR